MRDAMTSTEAFLHVLNGLWDKAIDVACTCRDQHFNRTRLQVSEDGI
jgi:hypothetical protein